MPGEAIYLDPTAEAMGTELAIVGTDGLLTNLISNPSFETDVTSGGWSGVAQGPIGAGPSTLTQSAAAAFQGSFSCRVDTGTTGATRGASAPFGTAAAGAPQSATVRVKNVGAGTVLMQLSLEDNVLGNGIVFSPETNVGQDWQEITLTWTPTALSTNARLYIYVVAAAPSASAFFLDAVTVVQAATPPPYFDTAAVGRLLEHDYPTPEHEHQWASSPDTEGELPADEGRYRNRTITIRLRVAAATDAALMTALKSLQRKVAKLTREGGTLKRTTPSGLAITFDILAAAIAITSDRRFMLRQRAEVTLTFIGRPFGRGAEVDLGDNVETTLPCLVFTDVNNVPGDVYARGRLVIDNDVSADQWWVVWGIQSRYYDAASSAALFYEAEGRTAMGGSATAAGPSGASGAGSNVMRNTSLTTAYQAILSTQASGAGAHLSHIGTFRVFARVQVPATNAGEVSIALEWGEGDFRRFTQNPTTTIPAAWEGRWALIDLGLITATKVAAGTQRWEGRVLAKSSTIGDDIDIDWLMFVPVDEGSGEVSGLHLTPSPTSFVARDEFDQTAGALNGKTLAVGGAWATSGAATDFQVTGSGTVTRNAGSEAEWAGRFAIAGTGTQTDVSAHLDMSGFNLLLALNIHFSGLILRYVDANNWVAAVCNSGGNTTDRVVSVVKNIAGTKTVIAAGPVNIAEGSSPDGIRIALDFAISSSGAFSATAVLSNTPTPGTFTVSGQDAALATGGTLASGKAGFYSDRRNTAITITFDNFRVSAPPPDAAIFASQSLELRHDRIIREDSGGTLWTKPSRYEGDYLLIPPAMQEGRTVRAIVKASRSHPTEGADTATDDVSARLFVTPRYLVIPEA